MMILIIQNLRRKILFCENQCYYIGVKQKSGRSCTHEAANGRVSHFLVTVGIQAIICTHI
jgi:hypothetical protein